MAVKTFSGYWLIGAILVLAAVGFGGYKLWQHTISTQLIQSATQEDTSRTSSGQEGLSNKTDTSNHQLDQDIQDIQNSMNQLQQDQSKASQDSTNSSQDIPQQ